MTPALVISDITVVDAQMPSPVNVLLREGRIADISAGAHPPWDASSTIDGRRSFLVPGLWESHTHLHLGPVPEALDAGRERVAGLLNAYARSGITSVVELGGPVDLYAAVRRRLGHDEAHLSFAGPPFTGVDGWPLCVHHNRDFVREVVDAADGMAKLADVAAAGVDAVKFMYDGERGTPQRLSRDLLQLLVDAAHARGLRAFVHVRTALDALEAAEAGADSIEHSFVDEPADGVEPARIADVLARNQAFFCPTLALFEQIGRNGDVAYLVELEAAGLLQADDVAALLRPGSRFGTTPFPRHDADECRRRLAHAQDVVIPTMLAAGVRVVAGSDLAVLMPRPAALLRELSLLRDAGLSSSAVLAAATSNAAARLGRDAGIVRSGAVADLVVLAADPRDDLVRAFRSEYRRLTICRGRPHSALSPEGTPL